MQLVHPITVGILFFLMGHASAACSRRAPSTTDCSTTTGECNILFSKDDPTAPPQGLPFPPVNTRTCYRTCHENGQCKSFSTVIHEQPLQIDSSSDNFRVSRIYSPNYGSGNYRKSTICRYSVKCNPGQILSYSVHAFNLETEGTCFSQQECVDWVELTYKNLNTKQRFCGTGEVGEVHVDGLDELTFEFASNRRTEHDGFLYFVTCIDPGFDQNAVGLGVTQASPQAPFANDPFNHCSQPQNMSPRPTTVQIPNGLFDQPNEPFDQLPTAMRRAYVVEMTGSIFYQNGIIRIQDGRGNVVNRFRGIERLEVANRFSTTVHRHYHNPRDLTFSGYGTLEVSGEIANFYQVGADPVFQPTPEESEAILEIERVINTLLGEDYFDVKDNIDDLEEEMPTLRPPTFSLPTIGPVRPNPWRFQHRTNTPRSTLGQNPLPVNIPDRVTTLASEYGHACNAILRATACTYQALIMGVDCNTGLHLQ